MDAVFVTENVPIWLELGLAFVGGCLIGSGVTRRRCESKIAEALDAVKEAKSLYDNRENEGGDLRLGRDARAATDEETLRGGTSTLYRRFVPRAAHRDSESV